MDQPKRVPLLSLFFSLSLAFALMNSSEAKTMKEPTIQLTASIEKNSLRLRYEVFNSGSKDLYLLNRLFRTSPKPEMSPNLAYVEFSKDLKTAHIKKGIAAFPENAGSGPTAPVSPYVSAVRAGSHFIETFELPLPLQPYAEYGQTDKPDSKPILQEFAAIDFTIDWYWRDDGVREQSSQAFGQSVIVPAGFKNMPTIHHLVSDTIKVKFPALVAKASVEESRPIGTATMNADRSIDLMLRAEGTGGLVGDSFRNVKKGDKDYERILEHLGGLKPGESKPVPPWGEP
jgi:hypothetical protein